ncbi:hypothetical protein AOT93_14345 [Mycobacteroides sp. H110]|nr:hypothetical protein AOT87_17680 [Mycobacteroides sp. H003]KRQ20966.1 hypothetical protein AOT91_26440 [Mycobacteroides sp. H092]KRQ35384.1 hypothetical protein AOT92_24100 [Mycobacteroides sp. H101]KRQ45658.1 hypothetical protein AOT88_19590 [Mycobacteroides sp. H063]KRQ55443.1 hypothetical protein AOT90_28015 [Mycobacteroides sp. H079]KRQ80169.1 hypothetical protein AOT93_14345 [Mycobacteroides sp. H110]
MPHRENLLGRHDRNPDTIGLIRRDAERIARYINGVPVMRRLTARRGGQTRRGNPSLAIAFRIGAGSTAVAVGGDGAAGVSVKPTSHHGARLRCVDGALRMQRWFVELEGANLSRSSEQHDRTSDRLAAQLAEIVTPALLDPAFVLGPEINAPIGELDVCPWNNHAAGGGPVLTCRRYRRPDRFKHRGTATRSE